MNTIEELQAHYKAVKQRLYGNVVTEKGKQGAPPPAPAPAPAAAPAPAPAPAPQLVDPIIKQEGQVVVGGRIPRAAWILVETASRHGFTAQDVRGPRRTSKLVIARHECIYRIRSELGMSLSAIGRFMNRDHTTILYACRNYEPAPMQEACEVSVT